MNNSSDILFKDVCALVERIKEINNDAVIAYTPLVEDICSRTATANEVERLLDYLLMFAGDPRMLELYKKVCRRYWVTSPESIANYILYYRQEYDPESLIGTEYEYLLDEDQEFLKSME